MAQRGDSSFLLSQFEQPLFEHRDFRLLFAGHVTVTFRFAVRWMHRRLIT
jgi:hypothetical protein